MVTLGTTNLNYGNKVTDLENSFKIHVDKNNNAVFNLNETVYFNFPGSMIKLYVLDHPLHWSTISYKIYNTTRLAWFLMKLNNVPLDRMFKKVFPSSSVFYVDKEHVQRILNEMAK